MSVPFWLYVALSEYGISETPGPAANQRILQYQKSASGPLEVSDDETSWCSGFISWVMCVSGVDHDATLAARSWLNQLSPLDSPRLGAVTVLWRKSPDSWQGHVGLWMGEHSGQVLLLGGNQNDRVCIAPYSTSRILGYRWPNLEG